MESLTLYLETLAQTSSHSLESWGFITIILAVFLAGEYAIVAAVMLVRQDVFTLQEVILASTVGTIIADSFWFAIGKYFPPSAVPTSIREKLFTPANNTITKLVNGRNNLILFLLRFLVGARLVVILHLAKKLPWKNFLLGNIIGTIAYLAILTITGLQLADLSAILAPAYKTVTSIISGVLFLYLVSKIVEHVLQSKTK